MQVLPLDDPEGFLVTVRVQIDDTDDFSYTNKKGNTMFYPVDNLINSKESYAQAKIAYSLSEFQMPNTGYHHIVGTNDRKFPEGDQIVWPSKAPK